MKDKIHPCEPSLESLKRIDRSGLSDAQIKALDAQIKRRDNK